MKYYNHLYYPSLGRYARGTRLRDGLLESGEYIRSRKRWGKGGLLPEGEGSQADFSLQPGEYILEPDGTAWRVGEQ